MVVHHHEKYDGTGYPGKLKGEEIPLGGRVLAVSDVFDAITSKRHYRDKMPIKNALDIIKNGENSHFDKKIVDIFFIFIYFIYCCKSYVIIFIFFQYRQPIYYKFLSFNI